MPPPAWDPSCDAHKSCMQEEGSISSKGQDGQTGRLQRISQSKVLCGQQQQQGMPVAEMKAISAKKTLEAAHVADGVTCACMGLTQGRPDGGQGAPAGALASPGKRAPPWALAAAPSLHPGARWTLSAPRQVTVSLRSHSCGARHTASSRGFQ